jgi:hypothetical protein
MEHNGNRISRRLTAEQQRLVVDNLDIARIAAHKTRSLSSLPDRLAAAQYGLCKAALSWTGKSEFPIYAFICCRNQIWNDRQRMASNVPIEHGERMESWHCALEDAYRLIEIRSEAAKYMQRFNLLGDKEQHIIRLFLSGLRWHEIAIEIGKPLESVLGMKDRAFAVLRTGKARRSRCHA